MAVTNRSTVVLTSPTGNAGSLGGTATILDGSRTLATIQASGSPAKGGGPIMAGSNNNWSLTVTWKADDSATGTAAGPYQGGTQQTLVAVSVDHGGDRPHDHSPRPRI